VDSFIAFILHTCLSIILLNIGFEANKRAWLTS